MKAAEVEAVLTSMRDDVQRKNLMRFFRTEKGEYGEGDEFLGLKVPQTRAVVKKVRSLLSLDEISELLDSKWHEVRLCGFLLLVEEMKKSLPKRGDSGEVQYEKAASREDIALFYLQHARQANNWDLVDLSCEYILGPWLRLGGLERLDVLYSLAESDNLWEQRIAVVTTLDFTRNGIFEPSLIICDKLAEHSHHLIHKAVGWILREVGKRDGQLLRAYLDKNLKRLSRTTLRYAIERFDPSERRYWLTRES